MESEKIELCKSLIEWFKVLNLSAPHSNPTELSDGVALAQALAQIAPETFTESWLSKIKVDVGTNWRLKVSNLKKVIEGIFDFYNDALNLNLIEFERPDALKIAEKIDQIQLGRLLQLVLGCAVNCAEKQTYITQIMQLEESLQRNIMRALQDLENAWQGASPSRSSLSIANFDLKILQEERDALAQKCYESEKQITLLLEEKSTMQLEISKLQNEMRRLENPTVIGDDGMSIGPVQPGSARYNELRRQLDLLKDELIQSETSREDLRSKTIQQEKEISMLQQKVDELSKTTSELSQLKDELDIVREANEKLKISEAHLATYKKKLEDYNDLKKQIKMLEERSAEYLRQNTEFEEDSKKYSTLKGQVELYKKEIQELHAKLDNEMSKIVKLEFDNKNLESQVTALQRTKDSLLAERDALRETIDELRCGEISESGNTVSKELLSPALKDKIERLEAENKALREGQGGQTALAQLLDDANKRNENLREQLKHSNERILSLTQASQSDDPTLKGAELAKQLKQVIELNEQKAIQLDEAHTRIAQVESTLATREQELVAFEAKYRKCVEKAKEVIKSFDPRVASVLETNLLDKSSDVESEHKAGMTAQEEKLMATAFYKFGLKCQRDAVDAKLSLLMGQGQSFLARQRQSAPRKSLTSTYKPN
ncbi:unnamed protein product [Hermetia illucens]|uniref:Protein hook n=1 Tax=Hermetia illucens TaxID=343691 RepID=A0A7R8YN33_HERIL|nr:protein hook isoform X2 [Hermetia illucens]CAD7078856.1 unnamed protein product [Hermetia illucens]